MRWMRMRGLHPATGQRARRSLALTLVAGGALVGFSACTSSPEEKAPENPLAAVKWEPSFEPDYVNLTPVPGVEPATKEEQDLAIVSEDTLEFPADKADSVRNWQPGKIVAAAPGEGGLGSNPFGYARRVVEVVEQDGRIIVKTERLGLQDIAEGEFQVRADNDGVDVDVSKLDKKWLAENLYGQTSPMYWPEGVYSLKDDPALSSSEGDPMQPGSGFCCKSFVSAISGAANAVANAVSDGVTAVKDAALDVTTAITPASFEDSVGLDSDISWPKTTIPLFRDMEFKKQIKRKDVGIELFVKGQASVTSSALLNPGFQVGARIPNPVNRDAPPLKVWMNIDSRVETDVALDIDLQAGVRAVQVGPNSFVNGSKEFIENVEKNVNYAQEVWAANKEHLTGDKDMKPEGTFTKVLFLSNPKTKAFMAGPVPVVITSTLQVNLVCGFEAKASVKGKLRWATARTFKFRAEYENGNTSVPVPPQGTEANIKEVEVLGGGEIVAHCGLVPRVNVLAYDTIGMYTGIRGSLVAKAEYASSCEGKATSSTPDGELSLELAANIGLQVGGRLQAPGSSFAKDADLGWDTPPLEPINKSFPLLEKKWQFENGGLGYCLPTCQNGGTDGKETDVDCGGGACNSCAVDKRCKSTVDCAGKATCISGVCRVDSCINGVRDMDETAADCGGSCTLKCALSQTCRVGTDCASGFCSKAGLCVATSCSDGIRNGNESGVDCGGSCGKCPTGTASSVASDCASGFSNGTHCVATSCEDRVRSGGETDRDCGGNSSCFRCSVGLGCSQNSDCVAGLQCTAGKCAPIPAPTCDDRIPNQNETDVDCGGSCKKCEAGKRCSVAADCESSICAAEGGIKVCRAPRCDDQVKNGGETGNDCGGTSSCARCAAGQACSAGSDCLTGVCLSGICGGAYTVGGTLTGLETGGNITLQNNGGDARVVTQNGAFTFSQTVAQSKPYAVTVSSQPTGQSCAVTNASGTMANANVTNVAVVCTNQTYNLGGAVSGLIGSVTLRNDGGNDITISQNGTFTFPAKVPYRGTVAVSVLTQPTGQACTVTNGAGLMSAADISNVSITCTSNSYTLGGTASGLKGSVVLTNNGTDLTVNQNGSFTFGSSVRFNTAYAVTVRTNPAGQTCTVSNGTGTVGAGNVTNIGVTCTDNPYTVGGSVSGLTGTVVLTNNGGNSLSLSSNGAFTFSSSVPFSQPYSVAVQTQPANQTCVVGRGTGTMGAGNVTNVEVSCTTNMFTLGGTMTGAAGLLVLQNNGGATLTISSNGPFQFPQPVAQGSSYSIALLSYPAGRTCSVANATGVVATTVSNIDVTCAVNTYPIGGTASGITGPVVLRNGDDAVTIEADGAFAFDTQVTHGAGYSVYVQSQPAGQSCSLVNASGSATAAVTNIGLDCSPDSHSLGGTVSGISDRVVLRNGNGPDLTVSGNGSFAFPQSVTAGQTYSVAVVTQPARRSCTVTNGAGTMPSSSVSNVTVTCTATSRLAFVTSATSHGSVSGTFGVDARCQEAARNASLGGTYLTWLSDTNASAPEARFVMSTVPYVRVDGVQVAANYAALTSGTLEAPINVTETGSTYDGGVWTSTYSAGTFSGSVACNGWTAFVGNQYGGFGNSSSTASAWSFTGTSPCSSSLAFYCFEQ